ncbi:hypothetical protein GCM10007907_20140 [Chitinimonas prasina]|uniref:Glycosyltransferase 2-like domain-containing protein n=1 Tax=Chitinimonas prasina TaxID=1434937 RepID=A0ABQ5YEQ9_9NEIS|nr:glycosyltransferase [Chitinimonas prasina]GLR13224.1 hypothetical protein GCM10007907_20140 [Chitinimonas prasina]
MADRILVFAPHPDDEVLGCGGLLAEAVRKGSKIRVVVMSDGEAGLPPTGKHHDRLAECRAGLALLGVDDIVFWHYPDGAIPMSGPIQAAYRDAVQVFRPHRLLLPAPSEQHEDHRRCSRGLLAALTGHWQGELWFYETIQANPSINRLLVLEDMDSKLAALRCHASQLCQYDYLRHVESLASLRGLAAGAAHAEAFLQFDWDGTPQRFFEHPPLLSVIIRASRNALLQHALSSLQRQRYPMLEVVLVWFGDDEPALAAFQTLELHIVPGVSNRSDNLNLGIAAARGDYLAILDEDDVVYQDHYTQLIAELQQDSNVDAAYAGCQLRPCVLQGDTLQTGHVVATLNRPFNAARLLVGNYIPIHALVWRASLLKSQRFDSELGAYEDWDLLSRLVLAGRRFTHLDSISCEYRLLGDSLESDQRSNHQAKGYQPWQAVVQARIAGQLSGPQLAAIASLVDGLEQQHDAKDAALAEARHEQQQLATALERNREAQSWQTRSQTALGLPTGTTESAARLAGLAIAQGRPRFSIILPVYNTAAAILTQTLASVVNQHLADWELCLIDDGSSRAETLAVLDDFARDQAGNPRVRCRRRSEQGGIVAASNEGIQMAQGEWLVPLDHDDLLYPEALLEVALLLQAQPELQLIYSDSQTIDESGRALQVFRKPDWSPELLHSINYPNHLTLYRRERVLALGGYRPASHGAQDYDLLLRASSALAADQIAHLPKVLYDWRAVAGSLAHSRAAKPWAHDAALAAVQENLARLGIGDAQVGWDESYPGILADWPASGELVHVIIPTHSNMEGLQACVAGLLQATDYPQLHITIVANLCTETMLAAVEALAASDARISWERDDSPFNWAAINQRVAERSQAPLLLFLNDDVTVQHPEWLQRMARFMRLPGVGVVGATLFFPDGSLQHNGIETDPQWIAAELRSWGERYECLLNRNVSAATGACLLVRRDALLAAGGFDCRFAVNYNDVDFCLAVRQAGWRIVQAVDARLTHDASTTRGSTANDDPVWQAEAALMREKWGTQLRERYRSRYQVYLQGSRVLHVSV